MKAWLLTIAALDAADDPVTLRYSDVGYISPDPYNYRKYITLPPLFTSAAFGPSFLGRGEGSSSGAIKLLNIDGTLDDLVEYAVDGRTATLDLVDTETHVAVTYISGTVQGLDYQGNEIVVRLRDPQEKLKEPHPQTIYGGTNSLPAGVDGTANDLKGTNKPRVYGAVSEATPKKVNTVREIWQVCDRADCNITAVFDRGVSLTDGGDYPDLATLQSTAPSAGQFRSFQGYFRLGSAPTGAITCNATSSTVALGDVFELIASEAGCTVNASDVTALNAVGDVRIYLTDSTPTDELLRRLIVSAGAFWYFDLSGEIRAVLIDTITGFDITVTDSQIDNAGDVVRTSSGAGENGQPIWRLVVRADRVETVLTDPAATAANPARSGTQYREAPYENAATKTRHPLAEELVIDSDLVELADAQAVADRLGPVLAARRDYVTVDTYLQDPVELGTRVQLKTPRRGYTAGRNMVVMGKILNARLQRATLNLEG